MGTPAGFVEDPPGFVPDDAPPEPAPDRSPTFSERARSVGAGFKRGALSLAHLAPGDVEAIEAAVNNPHPSISTFVGDLADDASDFGSKVLHDPAHALGDAVDMINPLSGASHVVRGVKRFAHALSPDAYEQAGGNADANQTAVENWNDDALQDSVPFVGGMSPEAIAGDAAAQLAGSALGSEVAGGPSPFEHSAPVADAAIVGGRRASIAALRAAAAGANNPAVPGAAIGAAIGHAPGAFVGGAVGQAVKGPMSALGSRMSALADRLAGSGGSVGDTPAMAEALGGVSPPWEPPVSEPFDSVTAVNPPSAPIVGTPPPGALYDVPFDPVTSPSTSAAPFAMPDVPETSSGVQIPDEVLTPDQAGAIAERPTFPPPPPGTSALSADELAAAPDEQAVAGALERQRIASLPQTDMPSTSPGNALAAYNGNGAGVAPMQGLKSRITPSPMDEPTFNVGVPLKNDAPTPEPTTGAFREGFDKQMSAGELPSGKDMERMRLLQSRVAPDAPDLDPQQALVLRARQLGIGVRFSRGGVEESAALQAIGSRAARQEYIDVLARMHGAAQATPLAKRFGLTLPSDTPKYSNNPAWQRPASQWGAHTQPQEASGSPWGGWSKAEAAEPPPDFLRTLTGLRKRVGTYTPEDPDATGIAKAARAARAAASSERAEVSADALPKSRDALLQQILDENGITDHDSARPDAEYRAWKAGGRRGPKPHGDLGGMLDSFQAERDKPGSMSSLLEAFEKETKGLRTYRELRPALRALADALGVDDLRLPSDVVDEQIARDANR